MVLKPSIDTFNELSSLIGKTPLQYGGEQGLLNWYFREKRTTILSARYNTVLRQKGYAVWPLLRRNAKIFHFVPQTAPWNFYKQSHMDWEFNYEPIIFYYWHQLYQQALQELSSEEGRTSWKNGQRSLDICGSQAASYSARKFTISNKFSVLIGTYERVSLLRKIILNYQRSRLVHKIYVTWHNPTQKPPSDFLRSLRRSPPVEILPQRYDSLNNRFNPIPSLETKAVLVCDDDVRVANVTELEHAFEAWKQRPSSLVGVFPRYHQFHPANSSYTYELRSPSTPRAYSIMLTKLMFMSSEYLFAYTCLLPASVHQAVDERMNCEDIALNLMVSGMTGVPPTAVMLKGLDDFGTVTGISWKGGHLDARSQCLTELIRLFGKDTLLYNRELLVPQKKGK